MSEKKEWGQAFVDNLNRNVLREQEAKKRAVKRPRTTNINFLLDDFNEWQKSPLIFKRLAYWCAVMLACCISLIITAYLVYLWFGCNFIATTYSPEHIPVICSGFFHL
jgi:hypothetical protein